MLKIEHLKKNYDTFSLDCSLELRPGYVTGLIGQNGAGKSTTFRRGVCLFLLKKGRVCMNFVKSLALGLGVTALCAGSALADTNVLPVGTIK